MKTDIEIASAAKIKKIEEIAKKINIPIDALENYGKYIAKIDNEYLSNLPQNNDSNLILVSAINPTPAGEGKTTTSIGLGDALSALGKKTIIALREPSLGPCFGTKGGAAGGGYSQILPMAQINLHFTGDFHAITSANNLLAAMIDNHIYWGNELGIDTRRIVWRKAIDMNDRALRAINSSLGGVKNGYPREDGFDITVASEIMAIFCLANDIKDLEEKLGNIIIAYRQNKTPVFARDIGAIGAMAVLLKDALKPNLVQTIEGTPCIVHGGPFANIAHGCNSIIATKAALKLADYVVTEAGFGADLGAEKFLDIKCRKARLAPKLVVLVATIRALKMHGGVQKNNLEKENIEALEKGAQNLERHINNIRKYGVECIVAINQFASDTQSEIDALLSKCKNEFDVTAHLCNHFSQGSKGAIDLANSVIELVNQDKGNFAPIYKDEANLEEKINIVATKIYGANGVNLSQIAKEKLSNFEHMGYGNLPICIAKTQYSFSSDPLKLGAPKDFVLEVKDVRLSAGAGFVVVLCGDIMTMPGLPKQPAALNIKIDENNEIIGLF